MNNISFLPDLKTEEFLIEVNYNQTDYYICCCEMNWYTGMEIELNAYRLNPKNHLYFSDEYVKRNVMQRVVRWVADISAQEILTNDLSQMESGFVQLVWERFLPYFELSIQEAGEIYRMAMKYWRGEETPLHPLIVEVDMLIKLGGIGKSDLRSYSTCDMERIKLILSARNECLPTG